MHRRLRKILRAVADYDPEYFDMYADPNETWFARLYLERIRSHAEAAGIRPPATVLEAGCQAGRLAVPLAQAGFRVTGIDTSGFALRRARQHAKRVGTELTLVRGDVMKVLPARSGQQYDMAICAEVLYLSAQYRDMLRLLRNAIRPGGLLCASHRPRWYYLLEALKQRDFSSAQDVLSRGGGPFRDSAYYNWQTEEELRALYRSLELEWIAMYPIDRLAWLSGVGPAQLSQVQRDQWLRMELQLPVDTGTCARYLLVVAHRPAS